MLSPKSALRSLVGSVAVAIIGVTGFNLTNASAAAVARPVSDTTAVVESSPGHLVSFLRTTDGTLLKQTLDTGSTVWSKWSTTGSTKFTSAPAVVATSPGNVVLFARRSDNHIWMTSYSGSSANLVWSKIDGDIADGGYKAASAPSAIVTGKNEIKLFIKSLATGHSVRQAVLTCADGKWTADWSIIPGEVKSGPAIVSAANGQLDLFAQGTTNHLVWRHFDGKTWSAWKSLGGVLSSPPAAVSPAPGTVDVYVRGSDLAIHRLQYSKGTWQKAFAFVGGTSGSAPSAVYFSGDKQTHLFVGSPIHYVFWAKSDGKNIPQWYGTSKDLKKTSNYLDF